MRLREVLFVVRSPVLSMVLAALMPLSGRAQIGQGLIPLQPVSGPSSGTTAPFELTGLVINARTHTPIARALVKFGQRAVMTDHDGVFSFPQVTNTSGMLVASRQGFYAGPAGGDASLRIVDFTKGTPVDLLLYPEAVITGVVASASGEGLQNFLVTARRSAFDETGHHWTQEGVTRTDSAGMYRMVLPPGDYTVQARAVGRPRGDGEMYLPVSVPAESTSIADALHVKMGDEVRVNLRPEARTGYVVSITSDSDATRGFPQMTAYHAHGLAIPLNATPERGDPKSLRVVLPNGTYRLAATLQTREGMLEGEAQVTVAGRDVAGVVMHSSQVPRLPVEVAVEPGVNTTNLTIPVVSNLGLSLVSTVTNREGLEQTYLMSTDANKVAGFAVPHGSFRLLARAGGAWYISGADCGGTNLLTENLTVGLDSGGQTIRIRISNQAGTVSGTVRIGEAPAQAFVYLIATMPSASPVLLVRSNVDGSFYRSAMAPGSYRVLAVQEKLTMDPRDPATLTRFAGKVQTVTVEPGGKQTLTLDAVPGTEMPQ